MAEIDFFARAALAAVFLCSSVLKARGLDEFDESVQRLGRIPRRYARPTGLAVVGCEAGTAVLLAVPAAQGYGFALAAAQLAVFTALLVAAVRSARGGAAAVRCACFGAGSSVVGRLHIVRNAVLLALALLGCALWSVGADGSGAPQRGAQTAVALGLLLGLVVVLLEDLAFLYETER